MKRKLFFLLIATVLLVCTACSGSFTDPGMMDQPGGGGGTKPDKPSGVTASAQSSNSIKISWSAVSGADGYNVYKSTTPNGQYNKSATTNGTSYTDNGLSPNTTYYYKVSAYNSYWESSQSATVSAKTSSSNNYTITFNTNGGTGTPPAQITTTAGSFKKLPNGDGFSRTNYTFGGWNTKSDGTGTNYNAGTYVAVTSDVTFYAKWTYSVQGSENRPNSLTEKRWTNGEIKSDTPNKEIWYSFNVTKDTTYYVWWNDRVGDGSKTLSIRVSASYSNGSSIFTNENAAWNAPKQFTASSNGTVKLRVYTNTSVNTGTFAIVYSTSNTRP
jgi:uncharacterized repeat protein (TIGR02543 family)